MNATRSPSILNSGLRLLDSFLNRFLQLILLVITAAVTWQVFSRYVLDNPSSVTEELARFLLIWITLLGCVMAYRTHSHLGLDMLYSKASDVQRKIMYFVIHSSVATFAVCVMIIGGFSLMNMTETLGQSSPVMGIDISLVYSVIPLSGVLIVIYAIDAVLVPQYEPHTDEE